MSVMHVGRALTSQGWSRDVRVTLGTDGKIEQIETDALPQPGDLRLEAHALLPAPANLHSHAFQRAMAGMTELRGPGADSFWSWRVLMYRFLEQLTPEQIEAIAAQVCVETLEAGYAALGEFHYLHHGPGGAPYADPGETSGRIIAAAVETGCGLTHLPCLYAQGGVDGSALQGGQRRFGSDLDLFAKVHESAGAHLKSAPADARLGLAPHSLRAVSPEYLKAAEAAYGGPLHIHVAEQQKEVAEIEGAYGARPVEWLLANARVGARWCLIHATHMTPAETEAVARSGAVVGLCPITEADLGDGIFDGARYLGAGGAIGFGSDSNIRIALSEELRTLEQSQRYRDEARCVLAEPQGQGLNATGRRIFEKVCAGGAQAMARDSGRIEAGALADLVALDLSHPSFEGLEEDQILDAWIFAEPRGAVGHVWSAGRHVVQGGRHIERDAVAARFRQAVRELRAG